MLEVEQCRVPLEVLWGDVLTLVSLCKVDRRLTFLMVQRKLDRDSDGNAR